MYIYVNQLVKSFFLTNICRGRPERKGETFNIRLSPLLTRGLLQNWSIVPPGPMWPRTKL